MRPAQIVFKEKQEGLSKLVNRMARNFGEIVSCPPVFGYLWTPKVLKKEERDNRPPTIWVSKLVVHAIKIWYHRGFCARNIWSTAGIIGLKLDP
jgi:hypothetical protein